MPSFNHEAYLSEAIHSVLAQTFSDFELIIVDDASADSSLKEIRAISDPRIQLCALPENRGGAGALNVGIALAQGEYIAIINSDDRWLQDKLEKQVRFLSEKQDVAAVFTHAACINGIGDLDRSPAAQNLQTLFAQDNRTREEWLRLFIESGNCLCHPSILIRKKCYLDIGLYDERYRQLPDYDMWVRLCSTYSIHIIKEKLVQFRLHGHANASASTENNNRRSSNELFFILENFFQKNDSAFIDCFGQKLIKKLPLSAQEMQIEKAFVFLNSERCTLALIRNSIALIALYRLFEDFESRLVLEQKYGFTKDDLFAYSADISPYYQGTENLGPRAIINVPVGILAYELLARIRKKPLKYVVRRGYGFVSSIVKQKLLKKGRTKTSELMAHRSKNKIRILFIGIINSPHTYHWIKPLLKNPSYQLYFYSVYSIPGAVDLFSAKEPIVVATHQGLGEFIEEASPHIIHTMHTQQAAYQLLPFLKTVKQLNAKWMHSLWGSDIYFWGRYTDHEARLKECLTNIDILFTEGKRDTDLAKKFGYQKDIIEGLPAFGGFDMEKIDSVKRERPSLRKEICIKGYVDVVGRFFVGLYALELVRDLLEGYTINVFSPSEPSRYVAELFAIEQGIQVRLIENVTKEEMFSVFARSRICMGVSLSDGLPASLVEGMAMGAFPLQTNTSVADEWLEDGVSGMLIPPNDPSVIAEKLRQALTNDKLVDNAAEINFQTVMDRADAEKLGKRIIDIYDKVTNDLKTA